MFLWQNKNTHACLLPGALGQELGISIEPPSEYTWHFGAQEAGVGNAVPLPAWQTLLKLSKLPASFSSLVHLELCCVV